LQLTKRFFCLEAAKNKLITFQYSWTQREVAFGMPSVCLANSCRFGQIFFIFGNKEHHELISVNVNIPKVGALHRGLKTQKLLFDLRCLKWAWLI
jgi:hypothetical protein